jgi:hypothetical protein
MKSPLRYRRLHQSPWETDKGRMIIVFQRPLLPGWVYPCTLDDIHEQLSTLPAEDLAGLWAVGLVPSTRRDHSANGRYFGGARPIIHLLSYRESLTYKQPAGTRQGDMEAGCVIERHFGMRVEKVGSRWYCRWSAEDLWRFILEHVLIHEVGHHVQYMERKRAGLQPWPSRRVSEQFAEAYACRYLRERRARRATRSS